MASANQSILSILILRGSADVRNHISGFLTPEELARLACVNRAWKQAIGERNWATQALIQRMIPEAVPAGRIFEDLYPGSFGPQFFREYLGEVGAIPPIPRSFIEAANRPDRFEEGPIKRHFQLLFVPAFITISAEGLTLNENGRLVEAPQARGEIRVPVTLNNIAKLVETCLKKGTPTGFDQHSWENIFQEHGDEPVRQSHWSYQRRNVIARGQLYAEQQAAAAGARLEIVSLFDRVLLNLLTYVKSGKQLDDVARTSTPTLDRNVHPRPWQSIVWWSVSPPAARLRLGIAVVFFDGRGIGVAGGMPAGSSQAIGP